MSVVMSPFSFLNLLMCVFSLCLVCLDAHLYRPGWSGEDLGLPTGQETMTALSTGEGGKEGVGGKRGSGGNGMVWGGGEEVEIFINKLIN